MGTKKGRTWEEPKVRKWGGVGKSRTKKGKGIQVRPKENARAGRWVKKERKKERKEIGGGVTQPRRE